MDRLNNSYQPKSDPPRRRMAFGCALKADNLLPAELYKTYRTTKKTIIPKSATKPKPVPVSAYHQLPKPKTWNCNNRPDGSEKSYEYRPRVTKKPSQKQIRRATTPVAQRNIALSKNIRVSSARENRIVVCGDVKLAANPLPTVTVPLPQYAGPMLTKTRPINFSDFSENSEIEISSWSPILMEKAASKLFLAVSNKPNAVHMQSTAEEKTKYARRSYKMVHYTKKYRPRRSSELVGPGDGVENPPKKAKKPQPSFRTYYNYSQHLLNEDKRSKRPQPVGEIENLPPEKPKARRIRNPVVTEMLNQWVSNYLPAENANSSNGSNIKGGSWIALSRTDFTNKQSKQQSIKENSESLRMNEQKKTCRKRKSKDSKKKAKCRPQTYRNSSVTVDNISSDKSTRHREIKRRRHCNSANSTNNGHNLVVCRFGTWRKYSKPKWNNIWTRAARRCGGFKKSFKDNCGHPMRQGIKVIKSMKSKAPVNKSYIDKKFEELTKKHGQKQISSSENTSSLQSKNNSNATTSGSNRATIGSSEVSCMTQSSQINVQNYHSNQASPTGTLNDVSGASCKIERGDPISIGSTCESCSCMKKPSRTDDCDCAKTANVGTSNLEMKPVLKQLVESITNHQAVFQQARVITKTDQDRASQRSSKKSVQLTLEPRVRKVTLKKYNTEVISVPVFRAPHTNHSCATLPRTRHLKRTEPKIISISSHFVKKHTNTSAATSKSSFVSAETQVERNHIESSDESGKSVGRPCRQSSTLVPVPSLPKQRISRASTPGGKRNIVTNIQAMTVQRKASEESPRYSSTSSPSWTRKSTNIQALNVQTKAFNETRQLSGPSSPSITRQDTEFQALLEKPLPKDKYSGRSTPSPTRQDTEIQALLEKPLPKDKYSGRSTPSPTRQDTEIQALLKKPLPKDKYSGRSTPSPTRQDTEVQALVLLEKLLPNDKYSGRSTPSPTRQDTEIQALALLEKPLPKDIYNIRAEKYESTTILVPNAEKPSAPPPKKRKPDEVSRIYYSPRQKPKTAPTTALAIREPSATSEKVEDEISSALEYSNAFPSSASYPKVVICRSGSWRRRPPWRKMWTKAVKGVTFWSRSCAEAARKKAIKSENVIIIEQEVKDNNSNGTKAKPAIVCPVATRPKNTASITVSQIKNIDDISDILTSKLDTEKNSHSSDVITITNLDKLNKSAMSMFLPPKETGKGHFRLGRHLGVESGAGSGNIQINFAGTDPIHALSDENNRAVQISNKDDYLSVDASIGDSDGKSFTGDSDQIRMKTTTKQVKAPILDKEDQFSLISTIQKTKSLIFDDTDNISVSGLTCQNSMSTIDTIKANDTKSLKSSFLRSGERRWSITEPNLLSISSAELISAAMVTSKNKGTHRGVQVEKRNISEEIQASSQSPVNTETVQSLIDYLATTTGRKNSSNPQSVSDRLEAEDRKPPSNNISLSITLNTNSKAYCSNPKVEPGNQALEFPKKQDTSSNLSPMKWIQADDKEQSSYISKEAKASAVTTFISNAATQYSTPAFKNIWNKIDERKVLNCSVQTSRESRHFLYEKQHEERKVYHCSVQTPNNSFQSYNVETDATLRLPRKRSTWGYPARCFPMTSWRSTREKATSVETQTEVYAIDKCPKCRTRLMTFGDDEEEDDTMDNYFKNPLISSCQYYTTMICKRIEQFRETFVKQYAMRRASPSSSESDIAISPPTENCHTMEESSHTSTTTEIQTQKTKLYASKDDTFLYSMRIENCTTKTDYVQLQTKNVLDLSPRASSSCCELGSHMCSMDMSGEHNRKNLNYVYYLFTAIEGRIRRII